MITKRLQDVFKSNNYYFLYGFFPRRIGIAFNELLLTYNVYTYIRYSKYTFLRPETKNIKSFLIYVIYLIIFQYVIKDFFYMGNTRRKTIITDRKT